MNARTVVLPGIALVVALAAWWQAAPSSAPRAPAATWRVGPVDDFVQARNYHELPAESPVRLSFSCSEPQHVYVFSHSAEDGTLLLHPSPDVEGSPANPLPTGRTTLPGERANIALAWTTRAEIRATTAYVVVASAAPVDELEQLLTTTRRWSNRVLADRSMQVTKPSAASSVAGAAGEGWAADVLARAAARSLTETQVNGPLAPDERLPGVWSASFRTREQTPAASGR